MPICLVTICFPSLQPIASLPCFLSLVWQRMQAQGAVQLLRGVMHTDYPGFPRRACSCFLCPLTHKVRPPVTENKWEQTNKSLPGMKLQPLTWPLSYQSWPSANHSLTHESRNVNTILLFFASFSSPSLGLLGEGGRKKIKIKFKSSPSLSDSKLLKRSICPGFHGYFARIS